MIGHLVTRRFFANLAMAPAAGGVKIAQCDRSRRRKCAATDRGMRRNEIRRRLATRWSMARKHRGSGLLYGFSRGVWRAEALSDK